MRAMILAAGLGTRLRPLTNNRPKALVEINGRSLLEITLARLRGFGIREVIVNVHHFAELVIDYLKAHDNFGMRIEVSQEEVLLDTGGGLKRAAWFFREEKSDEPFLLHNVDVISNIDVQRMLQAHHASRRLGTLAVQQRASSRQLLFDDESRLCGRTLEGGEAEMIADPSRCRSLAFCGIHIIDRRIFSLLTEDGTFPIVPAYLRLAGQGESIFGFRTDEYYWRDVGNRESLQQAANDLASGAFRKQR